MPSLAIGPIAIAQRCRYGLTASPDSEVRILSGKVFRRADVTARAAPGDPVDCDFERPVVVSKINQYWFLEVQRVHTFAGLAHPK